MSDTPVDQAKRPEQGTREAALWLLAQADRGALTDLNGLNADPVDVLYRTLGCSTFVVGAQAHALLYIGDQVKALVEMVANRQVRLIVDPSVVGDLLARDQERRDGLSATGTPHAGMCVCDSICRAITEAIR